MNKRKQSTQKQLDSVRWGNIPSAMTERINKDQRAKQQPYKLKSKQQRPVSQMGIRSFAAVNTRLQQSQ